VDVGEAAAQVCPSCGAPNRGEARFCDACGAALAQPAAGPSRERRKLVTLLFCDVSGSTALGERLDAESVREVMLGYLAGAREAIERHGGTVEKFVGDAVMAVFGVPVTHEDDALRACRAAMELRGRLATLDEGLAARFGSPLAVRIGINTGEVVAGDPSKGEAFVSGDAVNVAARLEQHAPRNEILLGELAARLSGALVEPVEPIAAKGKAEPVAAFRLLDVPEVALPRARSERFVGREHELAALRTLWDEAVAGDGCVLGTIVGTPGVGKSHLAERFLAGIDARVVRGRCLPYGEGISYWPVVEVVKQLDTLPSDPEAAGVLRALLGIDERPATGEEIAWAFRKLVEEQAPLAVCFDDLQWGEETFLELVESVVARSSGTPLLVLCLARPELLERRPGWPVSVRLEPLPDADVESLVSERIPLELHERVMRAAGGNPLFVEEMIAMIAAGGVEVAVPPTLQALLSARLDQLDPAERRVLEAAAVEGEVFHGGSVSALAPEEGEPQARLAALVDRELIRFDRPQIPGQDGYRFRHLLVRDAAYETLTKAHRAELHERYADWLDEHGTTLVERDELVGYHLEQAVLYLRELVRPDAELAARAGGLLAAGGRRALWRGDYRAAASLLGRALELLRPLGQDLGLELDLVASTSAADPLAALDLATAATERAEAVGDRSGADIAFATVASLRYYGGEVGAIQEAETRCRTALPEEEQRGDPVRLSHLWNVLVNVANFKGHDEEHVAAAEQAIRYARLAGDPGGELYALDWALIFGPRPADEALRTLEELTAERPLSRADLGRAVLLGMLDRGDEAWDLAEAASAHLREVTGQADAGVQYLALLATATGDLATACGHLRACIDAAPPGSEGVMSVYWRWLARDLCRIGRFDEAEECLRRPVEVEPNLALRFQGSAAEALILAERGEFERAEAAVRDAVAAGAETDSLEIQARTHEDLATVLERAGRTHEAEEALAVALGRYERKKIVPLARQVRARLEALRGEAGATSSSASPAHSR
jgi:class 3 adenylate cyclase/tetratricopeptide (TPR) repeat protein